MPSATRVKSLTNDYDYGENDSDDVELDIFRGSENEISDETWRDIEGAAPSQWTIMKEVSTNCCMAAIISTMLPVISYGVFCVYHTSAFGNKYLHIHLGSGYRILPLNECCRWTWMVGSNFGLGRCWNIYKSFRLVAFKRRCKRVAVFVIVNVSYFSTAYES